MRLLIVVGVFIVLESAGMTMKLGKS